MIRTRVLALDGAGAGELGIPPSRYVGTPDASDIGTLTNLGRALTQALLDPPDYELASGDVAVAGGTPGASVRLLFQT